MTKQQLLNLPGSVLVGSRAFGVETIDSDYDIAIKLSDLPCELRDILDGPSNFDIRKYFKVLPLGNAWYIPKLKPEDTTDKFDIIIFEDTADFISLREVVTDMKALPTYMLSDKPTRIHLFELGLLNYGFVHGEL